MDRPFWEDTYTSDATTFGEPSREVAVVARSLDPSSLVLDMGCGEGRNALPLARLGFRVDAFDASRAGIAKLGRTARQLGVSVNAWVEDVRWFEFPHAYDLIISHGVLHLLAREEWEPIIRRMKQNTRPGGVNVVAVFTDALPMPADLVPFVKGPLREGELTGLYAGWRIEAFESYIKEDEHPGGIRHRHPINKLVAQKP